MSCGPGKVQVVGTVKTSQGEQFVLRFLQARDSSRIGEVFFASYDPRAAWVDHLDIPDAQNLGFAPRRAPGDDVPSDWRPPNVTEGASDVRLHR